MDFIGTLGMFFDKDLEYQRQMKTKELEDRELKKIFIEIKTEKIIAMNKKKEFFEQCIKHKIIKRERVNFDELFGKKPRINI